MTNPDSTTDRGLNRVRAKDGNQEYKKWFLKKERKIKEKKGRVQDVVAIASGTTLPASSQRCLKVKGTMAKPIQMLALMLIIQISCLPGSGTFLWSFEQVGSSLLNH